MVKLDAREGVTEGRCVEQRFGGICWSKSLRGAPTASNLANLG